MNTSDPTSHPQGRRRPLKSWPRSILPVMATAVAGACAACGTAHGQIVEETYHFTASPLPLAVPDASGVGIVDSHLIDSFIRLLTDVNVTLTLSNPDVAGAYNGDLYVSLTHDSGFAVLMNRVGRREGSSPAEQLGYGDNGVHITLDDQAAAGDVHTYRLQLGLTPSGPPANSHNTPVDPAFVQPLTGTWAPDGRNTSPLTVTTTDTRSALLSSFNTLPGSGRWTLFVSDLNTGGTVKLESWSLQLSGAVPEPETVGMSVALVLLVWAGARRRLFALRG